MMLSSQVKGFLENASWIRRMFEIGHELKKKYGYQNVFDFTLGNPDLPPPADFKKHLIEEASKDEPFIHGYMSNAGYEDTREAIAKNLSNELGMDFNKKNIIMTCGAAGGMNVVLRAILNPGDKVVILSPYFVEYKFYILNHQGQVVISETDETFLPDIEDLDKKIDDRTKAIIINTPNNPTGRIYEDMILIDLDDLLLKKSKEFGKPIYLLSDEPYKRIVYSDHKFYPPIKYYRNTMIVNSFSKDLSIPGERIGYIAVPPDLDGAREIIEACVLCNRILGFINAPAIMQRVIKNLLNSLVDVNLYMKRRDIFYNSLIEMGYKVIKPGGTFYMFPESPIKDDIEFSEILMNEQVLVTPGSGFGRKGYFRISYCQDEKIILKSLERFYSAIKKVE